MSIKRLILLIVLLVFLSTPAWAGFIKVIGNGTRLYIQNTDTNSRHVFICVHTITCNGKGMDVPCDVEYDVTGDDFIIDGDFYELLPSLYRKLAYQQHFFLRPGQKVLVIEKTGLCKGRISFKWDLNNFDLNKIEWNEFKKRLIDANPNWKP